MSISFGSLPLVIMLGLSAAVLSACGSSFATSYEAPAPAEAKTWQAAAVTIVVPESLTTSEVNSFVPPHDIIWHGEPVGNRRLQVAAILDEAARRALGDLNGDRRVRFTLTLRKFHSLTPKAYARAPAGTGVHSVAFDLLVSDAATGTVLAGPVPFEASIPARTTAEMARSGEMATTLPGVEWRRQISGHVEATLRGWLGTGPDQRFTFNRPGA